MSHVVIIGAGPAGLMAAEVVASAGHKVMIYDHMPSVGRKFLMAGRGGLNLTHSENLNKFLPRYGTATEWLAPAIKQFPPEALRAWAQTLGQDTFIGSSGRVFPTSLKASPLLRAWLARLDGLGVKIFTRHRWLGWSAQAKDSLIFHTKSGYVNVSADAVLLALGGASWPKLGSDGQWVDLLRRTGIQVTDLEAANSGFLVNWSQVFRDRFQGHPLKPIVVYWNGSPIQGEAMITAQGLEGSVIYALSRHLRRAILENGYALLHLDLRPGLSQEALQIRLNHPRRRYTFSNFLRKYGGLSLASIGLLYENTAPSNLKSKNASELAALIKKLPIQCSAPAGLDRAISSAGGISHKEINQHFMLTAKPGTFVAGEMLDWEAPTGGYLLQGCFSTSVAAANGILNWLKESQHV